MDPSGNDLLFILGLIGSLGILAFGAVMLVVLTIADIFIAISQAIEEFWDFINNDLSLDGADYALSGGVSSSGPKSNVVSFYSGFADGGYGYAELRWLIMDEYALNAR